MKSLWDKGTGDSYKDDWLGLRVYTSQLLGHNSDLVLHGGGNTSVKITETDPLGEEHELLYVKGSGWDLATIQKAGFAPVKMKALLKMAEFDELSDPEMVQLQRAAMTNPYAPNPSVEAILHAIIPFRFVDHTHADAVVTITNTPGGLQRVKDVYGDRILIIPYVMPGFILAKKVYEMTKDMDWSQCEGLILMNHGVFTFHDDPKVSYEKMIELVTLAEDYLQKNAVGIQAKKELVQSDPVQLARIRNVISTSMGAPVLIRSNASPEAIAFSKHKKLLEISQQGPLTPDHVIRTKRIPMVVSDDVGTDIQSYENEYQGYFERHAGDDLQCLDKAPRWAVWPDYGLLAFGKTAKAAEIISDITEHTIKAIQQSTSLEKWQALPEKDIFDVEYWDLEQAKLKKSGSSLVFQGKTALVTGAASGIGLACVLELEKQGAMVLALDIDKALAEKFHSANIICRQCDVTDEEQVKTVINEWILMQGGLDIVVNNAGVFPESQSIEKISSEIWKKSLDVNLTAQQNVLKASIPFLRQGLDSAVIFVASKNVPAPGPGAAAYSVAKAGVTQLARVAALELGKMGIRVNVVHPNQVFDTSIWTDEVLKKRVEHYGMTVEEYKTNNLLKVKITSADVARMVAAMAGPVFSKTTGSQVAIDGGNERVV